MESNFSPIQISGNSDNEEVNNGEDDLLEEINVTSDEDPWARKRKSTSTPKKQKNTFEEDFLAAIKQTSIENEDRSFFESLLPTVRQFNTDQKLLFRSKILALTMEIKNGSGQTPNYPTPTIYQNTINPNDPIYFSHQQQFTFLTNKLASTIIFHIYVRYLLQPNLPIKFSIIIFIIYKM